MSLLSNAFKRLYILKPARSSKRNLSSGRWHKCRIEQMEQRQLLSISAPVLNVGAAYYEPHSGTDSVGNLIYISWDGGAPGTQLTDITIDTHKNAAITQDAAKSPVDGDMFFHTALGGPTGTMAGVPLSIVEQTGVGTVSVDVNNNSTLMTIHCTNFQANGRLVLRINVDEMRPGGIADPIVEGAEFDGSHFTAVFTAPHYQTTTVAGTFHDAYDDLSAKYGLNLPPDSYMPPGETPEPVYTAGLGLSMQQNPLPIIISGNVYEDLNLNNQFESGEPGIGGVTLTLLSLVNNDYVSTGKTATTDSNGHYTFDGVLPDTYRIVETQPGGYLSVGSAPGTVGGVIDGVSTNPDVLSSIGLQGGDNSIENNFGETRPASVSGYVYYDADNNGQFDTTETGISGVTVTLLDAQGNPTGSTTVTDVNGYYKFENLMPGTYALAETQPAGYLEGAANVGSEGGAVQNPDLINAITLGSGVSGKDYDFGEILPATISGKVFVDADNNGQFDQGDPLLPGVTIYLLDQSNTHIAVTQTDQNGEYFFTDLKPGTYGTEEVQPAGYYEGADFVGSVGGNLDGVDRIIDVQLGPGVNGVHYDFSELLPAKISGYVFQDGPAIQVKKGSAMPDVTSLRDGKLTPDDTRLSGIVMQLCDGSGYPMQDTHGKPITTVTDANGYYEFAGLQPGDYSVLAKLPDGYIPGVDTAGSKGGVVVNRYAKLDSLFLSTLAVDPQGDAIVKIAVNSGDAAVQNNFSVVKIETPPDQPNSPPFFPNPPPISTPLPPRLPLAPDPLRYGVSYTSMFIMPQQISGGSGGPPGYTWHLSVIDGGQPRNLQNGEFSADGQTQLFGPDTWTGADLNQGGTWIIADANGVPVKKFHFGLRGAAPVTGDWNGDGVTKIGVFIDGLWFLDLDGNGVWDENDLWAKLGQSGDRPVTGDWDGDGKTDIGIFGPSWFGDPRALLVEPGLPDVQNPIKNRYKNMPPEPEDATIGWRTMKRTSAGSTRSDLIDHVFRFGTENDVPVIGDWNGDGIYTVGIFRNGVWFLDMDGDGRWSPGDVVVEFGQEGDIPVVGDWTGDGVSKLGVYRNGTFYLDTNNNHVLDATDKVFALGSPGDKPFAGDFTGSGVDTVGVYHDGGGAETVSVPAPEHVPTPAPIPAGK
ncbi:MAG: SdrD B-like domain-containing protein [Thermoguttaceae bacterium]